jgi:hypothetical protein
VEGLHLGGQERPGSLETYHLKFVLPKLLLAGFIQERKVSDVVDEDVA